MPETSHEAALERIQSFWEETARLDRRQYLASFALAGANLVGVGVGAGIETVSTGNYYGIALVAYGSLRAIKHSRAGIRETELYIASKSRAESYKQP